MSKNPEEDIYTRISKERKSNSRFNQFVELCEGSISCWMEKIETENNTPRVVPKAQCDPKSTTISILLPLVPISPKETELLLEYLKTKYLEGKTKTIGGDYFEIKKCFFKKNYKLSSHSIYYSDF